MAQNQGKGLWAWAAGLLLGAAGMAVPACADDAEGAPSCVLDADCASFGAQFACTMGRCLADGTASTASTATDAGTTDGMPPEDEDDGASSGVGSSSTTSTTGPTSTSTTTTTEGDGFINCEPDARVFGMDTGALAAAVLLNFDEQSCAASSTVGDAPQLILDIRQTNLADMTADGLDIVDSILGTYIDSTTVTGIQSEVINTVNATLSSDGTPVIVEYKIETQGPALGAVRVRFG